MTSINVDDISGPEGESFKFDKVGDTAKGIITHVAEQVRENQFNKQQEKVLRICLEQADGETVVLWPVTNNNIDGGDGFPSRMAKAIVAAVRAEKETQLASGGVLAVQFSGEEAPKQAGNNPAKLFVAQYKAPAVAVPVTPVNPENVAGTPAADGAVDGLI